jgi:hypothetical protein
VRFFSTPDEFKSKLEPVEIPNGGIHVDFLLGLAGFTQRAQRLRNERSVFSWIALRAMLSFGVAA